MVSTLSGGSTRSKPSKGGDFTYQDPRLAPFSNPRFGASSWDIRCFGNNDLCAHDGGGLNGRYIVREKMLGSRLHNRTQRVIGFREVLTGLMRGGEWFHRANELLRWSSAQRPWVLCLLHFHNKPLYNLSSTTCLSPSLSNRTPSHSTWLSDFHDRPTFGSTTSCLTSVATLKFLQSPSAACQAGSFFHAGRLLSNTSFEYNDTVSGRRSALCQICSKLTKTFCRSVEYEL